MAEHVTRLLCAGEVLRYLCATPRSAIAVLDPSLALEHASQKPGELSMLLEVASYMTWLATYFLNPYGLCVSFRGAGELQGYLDAVKSY